MIRTPPSPRRRSRGAARRGAALMLAVFAMLVVGTATLSFVASRETASAIALNAQASADARALASSGMDLAKCLLRSSETLWRRNHSQGMLLQDYPLDGGTVSVRLVDIAKRSSPSAANAWPDDSTTELEVTVDSARGGSTWSSVAHMSIPTVVKGEYAIFANRIMIVDGSDNFIGRWPNAPMSSMNLRVNVGTQAQLAFLSDLFPWFGNGIWLQGGCRFEPQVAGSDPAVPDSMKSTWVYFPHAASSVVVQGAKASQVASKRMDPEDSVRMVDPPATPAVSGAFTPYSSSLVVTGGTRSFTPFRVRANFLPQLFTRNFEVRGGATVTLNAGTYEVWGSWVLRDSRIIVNGDVRFVVNPNMALTGLDWQNSSVELNANSSFEVYNGYSMDLRNCWVGGRHQYLCQGTLVDGDPHRRAWFGPYQPDDCHQLPPSSPQYVEPWRIRFYPMRQFLSSFFLWDVRDSAVVGSLFLPTNPIRLFGRTKLYGRVAANHVLVYDQASFYYDHALDLVTGFTEGHQPSRGGDPEDMFPTRIISYGFDAEGAR